MSLDFLSTDFGVPHRININRTMYLLKHSRRHFEFVCWPHDLLSSLIFGPRLLQEELWLVDALLILCALLCCFVVADFEALFANVLCFVAIFFAAEVMEWRLISQTVITRILNDYERKKSMVVMIWNSEVVNFKTYVGISHCRCRECQSTNPFSAWPWGWARASAWQPSLDSAP